MECFSICLLPLSRITFHHRKRIFSLAVRIARLLNRRARRERKPEPRAVQNVVEEGAGDAAYTNFSSCDCQVCQLRKLRSVFV